MPRQKHPDDILFCVYALFLKGHTETTVAAMLGLTRKQVSGIVNRSPYRGRAAMDDATRQAALSQLKAIHYDPDEKSLRCGGRLKAFEFTIEPLAADQRPGRRLR